ncbi:DUF362 domain-containing protein, partial [Turicibacter sp. HGF1]|uniref:DUF362 domain-containing protein n=1 Tax=Turicibacter sp. HGF1 TaxID=910310 RepID=UPI001EE6522B
MPRKILDTCIACGSCAAECPVECISEGDIYSIDADVCIDCGGLRSSLSNRINYRSIILIRIKK